MLLFIVSSGKPSVSTPFRRANASLDFPRAWWVVSRLDIRSEAIFELGEVDVARALWIHAVEELVRKLCLRAIVSEEVSHLAAVDSILKICFNTSEGIFHSPEFLACLASDVIANHVHHFIVQFSCTGRTLLESSIVFPRASARARWLILRNMEITPETLLQFCEADLTVPIRVKTIKEMVPLFLAQAIALKDVLNILTAEGSILVDEPPLVMATHLLDYIGHLFLVQRCVLFISILLRNHSINPLRVLPMECVLLVLHVVRISRCGAHCVDERIVTYSASLSGVEVLEKAVCILVAATMAVEKLANLLTSQTVASVPFQDLECLGELAVLFTSFSGYTLGQLQQIVLLHHGLPGRRRSALYPSRGWWRRLLSGGQ